MLNHNVIRRFTPAVLALAVGGAALSGCSRSEATSAGPCYPVVVEHNVSQSLHDALSKRGYKLDEMLDMNDVSSAINAKLVTLHQHANVKYDTVLSGDTFKVCVDGVNVSAGHTFSIIDE